MHQTKSHKIEDRILTLCIKSVNDYVPITSIISPMHATALAYLIWTPNNQTFLSLWLAVIVFNSVVWYGYISLFNKNIINNRQFIYYSAPLSFFAGLSWGAVAFIEPPTAETFHYTYIYIALISMNIVPQLGLSQIPVMHRFFVITNLLCLVVSPIYYGSVSNVLPIIFSTIWVLFFFLIYGKIHAKSVHTNFAYRIENELLSEKLKIEKDVVERTSAAKTQFLAAASHDLRQPLQAQQFFVAALQASKNEDKRNQLVENLAQSTQILSKLLNSLLDISKLDAQVVSVNLTPININTLFKRLELEFLPLCNEKNIKLNVLTTQFWTLSDEVLLENIIRNLLANALRYTNSGYILFACTQSSNNVLQIHIRDSGIGIPKDKIPFIYDEFYQVDNNARDRSKGLGLGLSIVKRTCDLLNHKLQLNQTRKKGSTFSIELKKVQPSKTHTNMPQVNINLLENKRVLVIDDDFLILESLKQILEQWGCQVTTALSGDDAVKTINSGMPDVIISDYKLGNNEIGNQAIEKVRLHCDKAIPALILTGETAPEKLVDLKETQLTILHKPVQPGKLRAVLNALIKA